jgi:hypothetical protein
MGKGGLPVRDRIEAGLSAVVDPEAYRAAEGIYVSIMCDSVTPVTEYQV